MMPNKTDAGNGSGGIGRVIDASRPPSPDPGRSPELHAMICRLVPLILAFSSLLRAEDVTVFRCEPGKGEHVSVGPKLATFTSGQKTLQTIYADFEKTSWTAEPFYGPIVPYIFKDSSGKLFLVHFEFAEGHKVVGKGLRFAVAPLKLVNGSKTQYTGSPYNGSSVTDEGLLKQLRELSVKKKP